MNLKHFLSDELVADLQDFATTFILPIVAMGALGWLFCALMYIIG